MRDRRLTKADVLNITSSVQFAVINELRECHDFPPVATERVPLEHFEISVGGFTYPLVVEIDEPTPAGDEHVTRRIRDRLLRHFIEPSYFPFLHLSAPVAA